MLLRGRHYRTLEPIDVTVEGDRIAAVNRPGTSAPDHSAELIAPAFLDVQINGCLGINFTSDTLTGEDVRRVAEACHRHGIGAFCPTVITASSETLCHALATLALACESDPILAQTIPGFHLEGPFLSPEDGPRGAHPARSVRPASLDEFRRFQDAARGRIRLVTLAPEVPGALALIEVLTKEGVRVAIGHSAASPHLIREAVRAGARLSTHLGNGCARLLPRHENLLWEQLAADEMTASIIPDGHHLPWSLVTCILRCKSVGRVIITCDASPLAGLPPGKYRPWGEEVEVMPEGKIVLASQGVLAGSWDLTYRCIEKTLRQFPELDVGVVHDMACQTPARFLGIPDEVTPGLRPGAPARFVLYDKDHEGAWRLTRSVMGERVYEIPSTSRPGAAAER